MNPARKIMPGGKYLLALIRSTARKNGRMSTRMHQRDDGDNQQLDQNLGYTLEDRYNHPKTY